jgi:hypothetical protein
MTFDLNMSGNSVKGMPVNCPSMYAGNEAVSWTQAVGLITNVTNNAAIHVGDSNLTNKNYVDVQDVLKESK